MRYPQMVMDVEIARIEQIYGILLERKEWLTNETEEFNKVTGSRRRSAQAQEVFEECDKLDAQALAQRKSALPPRSTAAVARFKKEAQGYARATLYPDREHLPVNRVGSNPSQKLHIVELTYQRIDLTKYLGFQSC